MRPFCRFKFFFGLTLLLVGLIGCENYFKNPTPQNATTQPATNPVVKPDKINDVAVVVGQVAGTVAVTTPPGSPVQSGATIVAAIAGLVITANEMLKKVKKPPG